MRGEKEQQFYKEATSHCLCSVSNFVTFGQNYVLREVILTGKSVVDAGSIPLVEAGSAGRAVSAWPDCGQSCRSCWECLMCFPGSGEPLLVLCKGMMLWV